MEKKFFPKWLEFLCKWLNSTKPDYEEVTKWYSSWRSVLDKKLINQQKIQSNLSQALVMMSNSLDGKKVSFSTAIPNEEYIEEEEIKVIDLILLIYKI